MPLSADRATRRLGQPESIAQPVPLAADAVIYAGAIISMQSGYANAAATDDNGDYALIAMAFADNTGGSNGDVTVQSERRGIFALEYETATLTVADVGAVVYAKDDGQITKTASSNTQVGRIAKLDEDDPTQTAWVYVPGELEAQ
jgi:predicted RecA/RadA family phage recombinase